jgi:hypothetical protein
MQNWMACWGSWWSSDGVFQLPRLMGRDLRGQTGRRADGRLPRTDRNDDVMGAKSDNEQLEKSMLIRPERPEVELHLLTGEIDLYVETDAEAPTWWPIVVTTLALIGATQVFVSGCRCWRWFRSPARGTVATQTPTTYTAVRGVALPRFLPLPDWAHGAWRES